MNNFESKNCWITGGGSGIGAALALQLAEQGAQVIISGRNEERLQNVADSHSNIMPIKLDVTNRESWKKAVEKVNDTGGHIDLAVFNAGTCEYVDINEFEPDLFKRVFDVNFMGTVNGINAVLPLLRKSASGHIAAVTSSVASLPLARAEAYGASKAATSYMMNSLRLDLRDSKIAVSIIKPGFVESPMTDKNDFPMPAIIPADKAARLIVRGLAKRKNEIYFPGRFTWPLRFLSILPSGLQQIFTKRFTK